MEWRYKLRLPKLNEAKYGLELTDSPRQNWIEKSGQINEFLTARLPQNGRLGVHACNDRNTSLCDLPVTNAETIDSGFAERVAAAVTCQFCKARLIKAGSWTPARTT